MDSDAFRGAGNAKTFANVVLKNSNMCMMRVCVTCKSIVAYRCEVDETKDLKVYGHENRAQIPRVPYCQHCNSSEEGKFFLVGVPNFAALGFMMNPVNVDITLFLKHAVALN
jgi:hypothetical protein